MAKISGRRLNGDGTIRQRGDGRFEGRVPVGYDPLTEKPKYKYVYASTVREVRGKMRDIMDNPPEIVTANGRYVKVEDFTEAEAPTTFGEWLDTWLEEYKLNSISPATYDSYKMIIGNHLKPALGDIPVSEITPEEIQLFLNSRQKAGSRLDKQDGALSSAFVIKMRNVINGALKQAVKNRIIPFNPTDAVDPPRLVQKEIRILTPEEQKKFIEAISGHRQEALFKLALATGMRKGEILALTWDCIDVESKSISIRRSANRVRDPLTQKTTIEAGTTKTRAGLRQIPMLPAVVPILEKHKTLQDAEKLIAGSAYNKLNLVFCSNVGTYVEPRRINMTLNKLTAKAKIDHINFHALRHTFATRALEKGIPARVVQEILGHSDVALTLNRYTHVLKATSHKQIQKMNGLFAADISGVKKGKKTNDISGAKKGKKTPEPER